MARALRLAERGLYTTMPNPRVGCVIAVGDEVVGEGWHERAGGPHAEVVALRAAGARARGATAYVTLEPCSHFGRTPPCADALIAAGVGRVVAASQDSNPRVAGGGFVALRAAGIAVETGLLSAPARELNRGFFARVERSRPWLRIKLATSLDGRTALANGESKWITGDAARADVQRWRARSSAILTGSGTALADDPRLTVRAELRGHDGACVDDPVAPLRVVLDSRLRVPASAQLLDGSARTLLLHAADARVDDARFERVECEAIAGDPQGRLDLGAALAALARRGANEVQVEAGPTLCGALLGAGLVDELLLYVAPTLLGDRARAMFALAELTSMAELQRWRVVERRMLGNDERILLRN
ncbi:MAG: bifunctional diaminohydroxyphosphoribosylaminopyrimidine deaminase/5-amino-6-(5-phosphoribosylamino)uracil reductase RibD [Rudaea sp.]